MIRSLNSSALIPCCAIFSFNLMEQLQYCVSWENIPLELDWLSVDPIQFTIVMRIRELSNVVFLVPYRLRMFVSTAWSLCHVAKSFSSMEFYFIRSLISRISHFCNWDQTLRDIEQCFDLLEVCVLGCTLNLLEILSKIHCRLHCGWHALRKSRSFFCDSNDKHTRINGLVCGRGGCLEGLVRGVWGGGGREGG